jgi:hypothetical protein
MSLSATWDTEDPAAVAARRGRVPAQTARYHRHGPPSGRSTVANGRTLHHQQEHYCTRRAGPVGLQVRAELQRRRKRRTTMAATPSYFDDGALTGIQRYGD